MTTYGYLERPYLSDPYLTGFQTTAGGMQVLAVIQAQQATGTQVKAVVQSARFTGVQVKAVAQGKTAVGTQVKAAVLTSKPQGIQVKAVVAAAKVAGSQVKAVAQGSKATGVQVKGQILTAASVGVQVKASAQKISTLGTQVKGVVANLKATGAQIKSSVLTSVSAGVQVRAVTAGARALGLQVRSVVQTLSTAAVQVKASVQTAASQALQVKGVVQTLRSFGAQVRGVTTNSKVTAEQVRTSNFSFWDSRGYLVDPYLTGPYLAEWYAGQGGLQVRLVINAQKQVAMQVLVGVRQQRSLGMQVRAVVQKFVPTGIQTLTKINAAKATGTQVKGVIRTVNAYAFQVFTYLKGSAPVGVQVARVRGVSLGVQATLVIYNTTNLRILSSFPSRGNGSSWTASSTQPGDFSANNLNTDIVEQQWRSALGQIVSQTLDCDTAVSQVFIDTFAMLNHNLTTSAVVTLQGSAFADQHVVGVSINIPVTKTNIIYVAPYLPMTGYRYWRLIINDPTNTVANQLAIGTIVFGASKIFQGDNITDNVKMTKVHFADKVATEGYTDVMNDRALKRAVEMNFVNLRYANGNYQALEEVMDLARTSLKCLWIPDPKVPTRFGVFAKMAEMPEEDHNNLGVEADYVSLTIKVDESL